ncbi:MAG TPA: hypothetical protein VHR45_07890 [Thermoanaerobaculia bacterium]|nr:hypothetical protein [Thermoanaerobaculia bacterium]
MQSVTRSKALLTALIASSVLSVGAALAADVPSGGGVTFVNESNHDLTLFVRYGSDASCARRPKQQELKIAAGQSASVDSGDSKVCMCIDVPERNTCPTGWSDIAPGAKRRFR